jgi:hypothetical protein
MRIHCDGCGAEIAKDAAIGFLAEDGEHYWFCSEACRARSGHLQAVQPPGADERGAGSGVDVELDDENQPPKTP